MDELFAAWLAGRLTPADAQRLRHELADPVQRKRWRALADLEGALAENRADAQGRAAASAAVTTVRRRRTPAIRQVIRRSWTFAGALALVLVVSGAWWWSWPRPSAVPRLDGQRLAVLDQVVGPTRLQWDDGSQVELQAECVVQVLESGKGLQLERGQLVADIVPQSSADTFQVRSAQALTTVLGTRFTLTCVTEVTTLAVAEGSVRFSARTGEERLVRAGETAAITVDGLVADSEPRPQSVNPGPDLVRGLVGWWPLDEGNGSLAHDRSGNGHHGRIHGASWSDHGLQFHGGDDRVEIAPTGALARLQADDYSIAAWFCPTVLPKPSLGGSPEENRDRIALLAGRTGWHIGLYLDEHGQFAMQHHLRHAHDDARSSAVSARIAQPQRWYHLVGVVDRTQGVTRVMIDGIEAGQATWMAQAPAGDYRPDQPWHIGIGEPGSPAHRWSTQGVIRDVRFYARSLSVLEVGQMSSIPAGK